MKKLFFIMVVAMMATIAVAAETASQKYTCPMHPEVVMDARGYVPSAG